MQSIIRSSASLVSPPTSFTSHSREACSRPDASATTFPRGVPLGSPSETMNAVGRTPLAAKSETHMATAFLEAIFHDIPGGTSVLATSMSHFRTTPSPGLPRGDQRDVVAYRDVALGKLAEALRD